MNDNQIAVMLIGLPILILLMGGSIAMLFRRAMTIVCPNCRKRFPSTDITLDGVTCLHCGWSLVTDSSELAESNSDDVAS
jgi:DNA-directed RNA polymerase subunit RPC12/RpoP